MKQILLIAWFMMVSPFVMHAQWIQLTGSDLELPFSETVIKHGTDWYAGTAGGVLKSTNNGQSWVLTNNNLYTALGRLRVEGFVSSGPNLVGVNRFDGIVTTTDGSSWTAFDDTNLPANYYIAQTMAVVGSRIIIVVLDNNANTWFLYYSTNNGANWTQGATLTGADSEVSIYAGGTKAYVVHDNAGSSEFLGETTDGTALSATSFTPTFPGNDIEQVIKIDNFLIVHGSRSIYRYDLINTGWTDLTDVWTNGIGFINVAGNSSDRLYASVFEGNNAVGFHTSTDFGDSWSPLSPTMALGKPFFIGMYATGDEFMASFIDEGLHYSSDAGVAINRRNSGALVADFDELVVSGSNLITSLFISGVYGSSNNGASWDQWNTGLPSDPTQYVNGYATDGTALYGNYYDFPGDNLTPNQIVKSTDNGQSWTTVTPPAPSTTLQLLGANGSTLFAYADAPADAYYVSTNGGANWTDITANLPGSFMPTLVKGDGTTAYLVGFDTSTPNEYYPRVYTSANNGTVDWTLTMTGIDTGNLQAMDQDENLLIATPAVGKAFFSIRYNNWEHQLMRWNINTWEEVTASGINNLDLESIGYHNGDLIVSLWNNGVYRSSNNGDSFTELGNLPEGLSANAMAFLGDILYISSNQGFWMYDLTTSLPKQFSDANTLYFHPNPASGRVTLNQPASHVAVYTTTGVKVMAFQPQQNTLDLSDVPNGVYILVIKSDSQTLTTKLIKQ